jgi:FkbM family methyltransferase
MNVPVYIISLERDAQRLKLVMNQLKRYDFLDLIWAKAFPGRELSDPLSHILTGNAASRDHKGTLGCFISHLSVWHSIANAEAPFALVVEDNAGFENCELLDGFIPPPDFDLIFCNARTAYPDRDTDANDNSLRFRSLEPVPAYVDTHGTGIGTDGYIISKAGAKKLVDFVTEDRMFGHVDVRMLAYCLDPCKSRPMDNLRRAGRTAERFRAQFKPTSHLAGYTMLPSLTRRALNQSTRVIEDMAGQQEPLSRQLPHESRVLAEPAALAREVADPPHEAAREGQAMSAWHNKSGAQQFSAHHPHWRGTLELDHDAARLVLKELGSTGSFTIEGNRLDVQWDKYSPEVFYHDNGTLVQSTLTKSSYLPRDWNIKARGISVECPNTDFIAELRIGDTDIDTFRQVFIKKEYDIEGLPENAGVIVDLGANIGLASLYFAGRFPAARVIAVEPDSSNFILLQRNIMQLGQRCEAVRAAIWSEDTNLSVKTHTDDGRYLGGWGAQTIAQEANADGGAAEVGALSMTTLIKQFNLDQIDILKVDIEGAELELFGSAELSWLDYVRVVVVETHERFRPGSHGAVLAALARSFKKGTRSGENHVFFRT